jgi:hypothetical protein
MLNDNMQSLAFSPIPEQNPIEAYGNMLHSDGFISVSGINRRKICRSFRKGPAVFLFGRKRRRFVLQPKKRFPAPGAEPSRTPDSDPPPPKTRLLAGRAQNRMTSVPKPLSAPKTRLLAGRVIFYSE